MTLPDEDHMVLVAEDDMASRTATRLFLQRVGYRVGEAADGPGTLREASLGSYDLVVLDLGLPGLDGEEVLARLRRDSGLPVIVLTGRSEESERVRVLNLGADDYVVKPCSLPELDARIRAVLRRGQPTPTTNQIEHDGLVIDRAAHRVVVSGTDHRPHAQGIRPPGLSRRHARTRSSPAKSCSSTCGDRPRSGRTRRRSPSTCGGCGSSSSPTPASPRWLHTVRGIGYRFSVEADD